MMTTNFTMFTRCNEKSASVLLRTIYYVSTKQIKINKTCPRNFVEINNCKQNKTFTESN